jgi:hypothetical protein
MKMKKRLSCIANKRSLEKCLRISKIREKNIIALAFSDFMTIF